MERVYTIRDGQLYEVEPQKQKDPVAKKVYTPDEARAILGLGRNTFMNMLNDGSIKGVKAGRKWLVPAHAIDNYLNQA